MSKPTKVQRINGSLSIFQDGDYLRIDALCPPVSHSSCNHPLTYEETVALRDYLEDFIDFNGREF